MPELETSLSGTLESPGVIGAALVDAVAGLTYRAVGDFSAVGEGFEIAELTGLIVEVLHGAGAPGVLESVVVTTGRLYEVVHAVPGRAPLDAAAVVLVLERERSNLALAVRQASELAESVLT